MAIRKLDKAKWQTYFDRVSDLLVGKRAEVEVASLKLGDQIEAEWLPLLGIVYDHKDDLIEIALEDVEHMIRAPNSRKTGKGYLKYTRPAGDDVDDAVIGEIGRENDEVGEPWDAIKQRNIAPDLSSIGGNSGGGDSDWD